MIKLQFLRQEHYWMIPLDIIGILLLTFAIYASPLNLRAPAALAGFILVGFTTSRIKGSYDINRARIHLILCLLLSIVCFLILFSLTN